jgi:hypothetical protein
MKFLVTLTVLLCALSISPSYSEESKIAVSVSHSGSDPVGLQLAYSLKEAIRGSNGYRLESDEDSLIQVHIVSIDPDDRNNLQGNSTAAAITLAMRNWIPLKKGDPQTWLPIFLTSSIRICGANRVNSTASSILAEVDRALEDFRKSASQSK